MQPYFFPYPAYFQLIMTVDKFVVYDDVQYISRGWINRNRILLNNKPFQIVMPVKRDSRKKSINERYYSEDSLKSKTKLLIQIEQAYKKAPSFEKVFPIVLKLLFSEERNVSKYNTLVLQELCDFLQIRTPFYLSSDLNINKKLSGEKKIININQVMGSSIYINSSGGEALYHKETFLEKGIELKFLKRSNFSYKQFNNSFIPDLSIIDLLMFSSMESVRKTLEKYQLE